MSNDKNQMEMLAREAFVRGMLDYTARLVRVVNSRPTGGAGSGILYQTGKRLFLLSVLHIFDRQDWALETNVQTDKGRLLISIPEINWLVEDHSETSTNQYILDGLAWAELDYSNFIINVSIEEQKHGRCIDLPIYCGPLDCVPLPNEAYGFGSNVGKEFHADRKILAIEPVYELGMEYDGVDNRGFYRFKLEGKHRGNNFYKGSSGSPIMDTKGRIVGLVQGGELTENVIFAVPTLWYSRIIS